MIQALARKIVSKAYKGSAGEAEETVAKKGFVPGESLRGSTWQKKSVHVLAKFLGNKTAITEVSFVIRCKFPHMQSLKQHHE